jgi:hypothetical protein
MSACVLCGLEVRDDVALCAHHLFGNEEDWAACNRVMCDFVHRGVTPRRLPREQREEADADAA